MNRPLNTFKLTSVIFIFQLFISMGLNAQSSFGGLALYTLRDDLSVALEKTLKQVSDEGYAIHLSHKGLKSIGFDTVQE